MTRAVFAQAWGVALAPLLACAGQGMSTPPAPTATGPQGLSNQRVFMSAQGVAPAPTHTISPPTSRASPDDIARARALVAHGDLCYRKGDYTCAENALQQAITAYPFVAEANVLLGKIFLIRGSASRDRTLLESARLMFEMARAIDPELREAQVLLDLFRATYDK